MGLRMRTTNLAAANGSTAGTEPPASPDAPDPVSWNNRQQWNKGTDIDTATDISASRLQLPDDGNFFEVVGSDNIDGLQDIRPGMTVRLRFASTPSLVNSANFILIGGATRSAQAGEVCTFTQVAADTWVESASNKTGAGGGGALNGTELERQTAGYP